MSSMEGISDVVSGHARRIPDRVALRFLGTGDVDGRVEEWTYGELEQQIRTVAAGLTRTRASGPVLLLQSSGPGCAAAFLGTLRAGRVAVPVPPPDERRHQPTLTRLERIAADCGATTVVVTADVARRDLGSLTGLERVLLDAGEESVPEGTVDGGSADGIAFLQYTSGSTGDPRGVVVGYDQLAHNLSCQQEMWELGPDDEFVSWLPTYHDMGLIAGILLPLSLGATVTMMAPEAFVQRPMRWLEAIARYRGTFSIAPNFAYDLCVRRGEATRVAGLDLSSWRVAANGAEPVHGPTLDRFAERFDAAGFDPVALTPAYGLAEATLMVSSVPPGRTARRAADRRRSVSCGVPAPGVEVRVVDPVTAEPCADGVTGEIWVGGPSVGRGYHNRPETTEQIFHARTADGSGGRFLRTGDLGFLDDGELFVTGRLKDLVIVGGANHYPQDIERVVEAAHPGLRAGCSAAFAVEEAAEERLVVVAEVAGGHDDDHEQIVHAIRDAVSDAERIPVHAVALIAPRSILKTSSGKIRRAEMRERYRDGLLHPVHDWTASERTPTAIRTWLRWHVALRTGRDPQQIATDVPFRALGLTSVATVELTAALATFLEREIAPTALYEFSTIEALAAHLTGSRAAAASVPVPAREQEPIAIVGIGCRFPGAAGPQEFFRLLASGTEAIGDIPPDRWDVEAHYRPGTPRPGKMYVRRGGFLGEVTGFDPEFFGMSDLEARYLDPQQRLLLELTWEAFEDAGVLPPDVAGTTAGVFVGITTSDYADLMRTQGVHAGPYSGTGNVFSLAANRISYTFDLRGPSIALDTACSSSLVAIHQACHSLWRGESALALAGGVNLMLSPETTAALCQSGALSPDGRCHTFDSRANGYVRGEGAGLVLLKPLSQAVADGDRVHAVIRGTAVNQDGRSNGLSGPNPEAHVRVIRSALDAAGLRPGDVQYVEAHGTGTALGDPIEAGAIAAAHAPASMRVGSVKTNIGHLEAAAGVAGLIKIALAIEHGVLPPSLHFAQPNEHIDFAKLRMSVPVTAGRWPQSPGDRSAGVNSFGVGGTNAHVIVAEAPAPVTVANSGQARLIVLSARSPEALEALAERTARSAAGSPASIDDLAYTAGLRRTHHEHRMAVVARTPEELAERLTPPHPEALTGRVVADRRVVFVFPGQGSQHLGMGHGLYRADPAFQKAFDDCAAALQPHLAWPVRDQFFAVTEQDSMLDRDDVVQPLLFAVQVALAASWRSRGIEPAAVVGHSMGEVAAAYVAGALTLAEAARVTGLRANGLATLRGQGAMAVVGLAGDDLTRAIEPYASLLSVAVCNGPEMSVVSGDVDAIEQLIADLAERDVFGRRVRANGAGHSPVVQPVADELRTVLATLRPRPVTVPMYSSVTTASLAGTELDGAYWAANIREPVLYHQTVQRLCADGYRLFVEMSPNPTLTLPTEQVIGPEGHAVASLRRGRPDPESLLEALGALHVYGVPVDLGQFFDRPRPVVSMPSGPWKRTPYWFGPLAAHAHAEVVGQSPKTTADVVRAAFSGVLRTRVTGGDDNFFALGGSSLMAAQMMHELRATLDCDIPVRLLFDNPTVSAFAAALDDLRVAGPAAVPRPVRVDQDDFPLTINQERYLQAERAGGTPFLVTQHLDLAGPVDPDALARAIDRLVAVHDGLRTVFTAGDVVRQRHAAAGPVAFPITDLTAAADPQAELARALTEAERPFDPFTGPLYRFGLVRLTPDRHVLTVVLHHLITDGWSAGVLFQDLVLGYEDASRPAAPPLRLADYAQWERSFYSGVVLDQQLEYWRKKLATTSVPALRLARDEQRVAGRQREVGLREVELDGEVAAGIEQTARAAGATTQMVMLTAFMLALHRQSEHDEITVPINVTAREAPELQRVVGFLSQLRLITVDLGGGPDLRECLRRVREAVLTAGEEQGLSMSQYFHLAGRAQEDIPYRISFNHLPEVALPTTVGAATVTPLARQSGYVLPRDLVVVVRTMNGRLRLSFGYDRGVIVEEGLTQLMADTQQIATAMTRDLDGAAR
ncbi:beta-ketoacyl synthase N-terminal-like domain-containing protein [Micromonospora humida]|uniref:beta-ketoacyl synthase N-terminal-like domain-containing protein n=2 Tax=Micromonospora humida TaxID=2809018 RepID=UPI0033E21DF5